MLKMKFCKIIKYILMNLKQNLRKSEDNLEKKSMSKNINTIS